MEKVKCDHCGIKIDKEKSNPCVWKEYNLIWYYCDRCEEEVFCNK